MTETDPAVEHRRYITRAMERADALEAQQALEHGSSGPGGPLRERTDHRPTPIEEAGKRALEQAAEYARAHWETSEQETSEQEPDA